jgi:hypothetical protein
MISIGDAFRLRHTNGDAAALAALGELVVERAGVISISLKGSCSSARCALAGATHGRVAGGVAAGVWHSDRRVRRVRGRLAGDRIIRGPR